MQFTIYNSTMPDPILELEYLEFDGARATRVTRPVIAETPWVLYVDRRELVTFMCSPIGLHHLALGFLLSEDIIRGRDDVWQLKVYLDEDRVYMYFPDAGLDGVLSMQTCEEAAGSIDVRLRTPMATRPEKRILTSGCGGGVTFDDLSGSRPPLQSDLRITTSQIAQLMRQLNESATLYRASRGVHTSALADAERLLVLAEDVGRHNTLDKIRGAPIVMSRTSPTITSIRLAQSWDMTLIGYVRGRQMRIYTGAERIIFG